MDPLTLAVGVGATVAAGVGTGLRLKRRLRRAEATAARLRRELAAERHAANHDALTGLPNRRAFFRIGSLLVADRSGPDVACVVVDLNSFKQVNDELGHAAGDEVLVTVARRLAGFADNHLVARLGGDEFAGLFANSTPRWSLLYPAADDLADLLATPMSVAGQRVRVTASVGAAAVRRDRGLAIALQHADSAMYRAKATGARAACFNPALDGPGLDSPGLEGSGLDGPGLDGQVPDHRPVTGHARDRPALADRAVDRAVASATAYRDPTLVWGRAPVPVGPGRDPAVGAGRGRGPE